MEKKKVFLLVIIAVGILVIAFAIYKISTNGLNVNINGGDSNEKVDDSLIPKNVVINADGIKENINEELKSPIVLEEFELKNISLKYANGLTDFSATVVNNSETNYNDGVEFNVYFYDDTNKLMIVAPVLTSTLVSKGESNINASITMDCTSANSIKVEIVK